jgi:hypothetical protein
MLLIIATLLLPLARFFEGIKDAIDFHRGSKDMGIIWHLLKFPIFGLIFAQGVLTGIMLVFGLTWGGLLIFGTISVMLAFIVFEVTLWATRKLLKKWAIERNLKKVRTTKERLKNADRN